MFVFLSPESFVPKNHPLRAIRKMVDRALTELDPEFQAMYSHIGRPSIAPEKLLKGLLLQAFYTIKSNRLLVEQINYNVLFRWFLGLSLDEKVWDHSSFSTNQQRLIQTDVARKFLAKIADQAREKKLLSDEHFSVDGTMIEAWASIKSFQPKDDPPQPPGGRNEERDFHGKKLKNDTHASTTDPDARLLQKGQRKGSKALLHGPRSYGKP
jgi:transposase